MALGTNGQTVTTGNVFRPTVWANDVMDILKSELVLLPRIKHYDSEASSMGQTVSVPFMATASANDKVANTQVVLNGGTATKVDILINKHKESSVLIEDILDIQSKYELRSEFTKPIAYAIVEAIDTDILTELKAAATASSQTVGTFGVALADSAVVAAKVALDAAKAPQTDRTLAVDPYQHGELLKVDKYVRYDALGTGKAIENGKVGNIYGFEVVMSQNIPFVDTTTDEHTAVAFHKDAVGIAHQLKPRTQAQYKQEYLGWLLTVDTVYGVKTLRPTFAVSVKS
jgi:hypothetical protein